MCRWNPSIRMAVLRLSFVFSYFSCAVVKFALLFIIVIAICTLLRLLIQLWLFSIFVFTSNDTPHTHDTHKLLSFQLSLYWLNTTPHHLHCCFFGFSSFWFVHDWHDTWHIGERDQIVWPYYPLHLHHLLIHLYFKPHTHTQYMNSCWHSAAMCSAMRHIHTHTHIHVSPHRTPYGRAPLSIEPISCTLFHGCAPLPSLLPVLFAHSLFGRVCCQ